MEFLRWVVAIGGAVVIFVLAAYFKGAEEVDEVNICPNCGDDLENRLHTCTRPEE